MPFKLTPRRLVVLCGLVIVSALGMYQVPHKSSGLKEDRSPVLSVVERLTRKSQTERMEIELLSGASSTITSSTQVDTKEALPPQ